MADPMLKVTTLPVPAKKVVPQKTLPVEELCNLVKEAAFEKLESHILTHVLSSLVR